MRSLLLIILMILTAIGFIAIIVLALVHTIHEAKCEKEDYYFRYEGSGGLFGGVKKVATMEDQADGVTQRCKGGS